MIYEYSCECGHIQEEIHGMNENPKILCEKCSKVMSRVITGGAGVIFKGGGWTSSDSNFKQSMEKKSETLKKKMTDHNKPISSVNDL